MLRKRGWVAVLLVCLLIIVLSGLEVRRLWGLAPGAQRTFAERNSDCVRCHGDMLARVADASVHLPFKTGDCETCHTPHAPRQFTTTSLKRLATGGIRAFIDRILIAIVSRVVPWDMRPSAFRGQAAAGSSATSSTADASAMTSDLTSPANKLCWTCHGDMGPMLGDEYVHKPFGNGNCVSCHDPHSSSHPTLLTAESSTLCVSCHRVGPELEASVVHRPFGDQACVKCHNPHASEYRGILVANQRTLCVGCHPQLKAATTAAAQHTPVATGDCTGCHLPHAAERAQLLVDAAPALCYRCHSDVQKSFASSSSHPVACARCHDPHASDFAMLLPSEQRDLCLGCHTQIARNISQRKYEHKPAAKGDCTQCHVPHGSKHGPLMAGPQSVVCRKCHEKKGGRPPTTDRKVASAKNRAAGAAAIAAKLNGAGTSKASARARTVTVAAASQSVKDAAASLSAAAETPPDQRPTGIDAMTTPYKGAWPSGTYSHPDSSTADGFECGACHEPHGSDFSGILIADVDQLCTDCHAADIPAFASSKHGGMKCTECHSLHDSPDPMLLSGTNRQVCTRCHADSGFVAHPVGSAGVWDYNTGTPMTCTSTCHDPHGAPNYRMLRYAYNSDGYGSDYLCLICHTEVGITY